MKKLVILILAFCLVLPIFETVSFAENTLWEDRTFETLWKEKTDAEKDWYNDVQPEALELGVITPSVEPNWTLLLYTDAAKEWNVMVKDSDDSKYDAIRKGGYAIYDDAPYSIVYCKEVEDILDRYSVANFCDGRYIMRTLIEELHITREQLLEASLLRKKDPTAVKAQMDDHTMSFLLCNYKSDAPDLEGKDRYVLDALYLPPEKAEEAMLLLCSPDVAWVKGEMLTVSQVWWMDLNRAKEICKLDLTGSISFNRLYARWKMIHEKLYSGYLWGEYCPLTEEEKSWKAKGDEALAYIDTYLAENTLWEDKDIDQLWTEKKEAEKSWNGIVSAEQLESDAQPAMGTIEPSWTLLLYTDIAKNWKVKCIDLDEMGEDWLYYVDRSEFWVYSEEYSVLYVDEVVSALKKYTAEELKNGEYKMHWLIKEFGITKEQLVEASKRREADILSVNAAISEKNMNLYKQIYRTNGWTNLENRAYILDALYLPEEKCADAFELLLCSDTAYVDGNFITYYQSMTLKRAQEWCKMNVIGNRSFAYMIDRMKVLYELKYKVYKNEAFYDSMVKDSKEGFAYIDSYLKENQLPQTGDATPVYLAVAAVSGAVLLSAAAMIRRKKKFD